MVQELMCSAIVKLRSLRVKIYSLGVNFSSWRVNVHGIGIKVQSLRVKAYSLGVNICSSISFQFKS